MKKKFIMLLILLTLFIPVSTKAFDLDLFQVLDNTGSGVNETGRGGNGKSFDEDIPVDEEGVYGGGGAYFEEATCISGELNSWLNNAFKFIEFAGIGLAVVLTAFDFVQVIGGAKEDDLKNAFNRAIKRLVAVILLLLTKVLVSWIIVLLKPVIDIKNCVG